MPQGAPSDREVLWRQYKLYIDLYKYYSSTLLKLNTLHYAVTGAILSFYLAHADKANLRWALVLPAGFSVALLAFFLFGMSRLQLKRKSIAELGEKLGLPTVPDISMLGALLIIFATLHVATFAALVLIVCNPTWIA